ncbi:MAG: hypothetical protein JNK05_09435 [Myxococcales bacterium]|nr:hypothetical protein [Myxococcales bacterium]
MTSPRFVRIVRTLALVGTSSLAACTGAAPANDASTNDVRSMADSTAPDATQSDSSTTIDAQEDVAVADTRAPDDRPAPSDTGVADSAPADVTVADTGTDPCSPFPTNGARCTTLGAMCSMMSSDGSFTQCSCDDTSSWRCFTAVPGPLPPPELDA